MVFLSLPSVIHSARSWPIALPLLAFLWSQQGQSQSSSVLEGSRKENTPAKAQSSDKKTEKISVIGSRIKRTEIENTSPTVTISREQIESSGASTVGDILKSQAVASTGTFSGEVGYVRGGAQTGNLYGLGPGRTLVLVDGQRLPKDASLSGTNISIIPAAMVERIEILTGSRSAVYGSDAVAGVMNIITRKDFTGSEVKTSLRVPEDGGGERAEISASTGLNFASGNIVISAGGSKEKAIFDKNRDISDGEGKYAFSQFYMPQGTFNYRILDSNTQAALKGSAGLWQPSPNCPIENQGNLDGPNGPARGTFCLGNIRQNQRSEMLQAKESGFISSKLSYELGSQTNLSGFAAFTQQKNTSNSGNYFNNPDYVRAGRRQVLSAAKLQELGLNNLGNGENPVEVYAVDPAAPDRIGINTDRSYGGFLALETTLFEDWNTNFSLTHYTTTASRDVSNVINRQAYSALVSGYQLDANANPLTLVDPVTNKTSLVPPTGNPIFTAVDPERDTGLYSQMTAQMNSREKNQITALSADFGRELLTLPGGKMAFNVGVDGRLETFRQSPDELDTQFWQNQPLFTGTEGVSGSGDRNVASLYTEFLAPVSKELALDFAARLDNYSDFGSAGNYNFGAKLSATETLSLRASAGTSFRAPELNYLYQKGGGGYVSIRDEKWCEWREANNNPCLSGETRQIFVDRPGNLDLQPERSKSYSIGTIYEPNRNFYLSLDYAGFAVKDVFSLRPVQKIVDAYYGNEGFGPSRVSQATEGGYIQSIARPWENIGQELIYLVQVESSYQEKVGDVQLAFKTDATNTLSRKEEQADGTLKQLNGYEGSPKWRWNNSLTSSYGKGSATLSSSTISKQAPDPENLDTYDPSFFNESVPEYTRYDASFGYQYLNQGKFTVGVINIFNKIGGLYRTGNFTGAQSSNGSLYSSSWYGRTVFANVTQTF